MSAAVDTSGAAAMAEAAATAKAVGTAEAVTVFIMMEDMVGEAVIHRRSNASLHVNRRMECPDGWDALVQVRHLVSVAMCLKDGTFKSFNIYRILSSNIPLAIPVQVIR